MHLDPARGEIGFHDAAECVGRIDGFVEKKAERSTTWEDVFGEEGDDFLGVCRGEVAEAAFRYEERRDPGLDVRDEVEGGWVLAVCVKGA